MIPPLFDQCQYSMLERQNVEVDLAPLYPELGTTVFGGLASGLLSGKYSSDPSTWREEWRLAGSEDVAERAPVRPPGRQNTSDACEVRRAKTSALVAWPFRFSTVDGRGSNG